METYPHCGRQLPPEADTFYPDCFALLDEPPTGLGATMTAGQEPRSETPVDVIAASRSDAVATSKRAPRVWTVFVVYVAALLGTFILQALLVATYISARVAG